MSLSTALDDLRTSISGLREGAAELAITVHDIFPFRGEAAAIDHLGEVVSEFQASVAEAAEGLHAIVDARELPGRLHAVDKSIAASHLRYWRDLRSHAPLAELRFTARERGVEWRAWQGGLEQSLSRCEEPLLRSTASVRAAWREVGELLSLYLPATDTSRDPFAAATAGPPSTQLPGGYNDNSDN